ncbi:DNA translocase FtsK [Levilactobacillus suantsaiihabitans]|uniref:DNA translocase FtsK n=1 Tax=Levilactobacillus suantsaiihabitans TaxID=2487722 RepID=A0A4Z0J859_9LACO|nr:DNA translocase FtsK [Levilactobacillus suantsaiihabitans]TGD18861.1 DNA translocase FtsK [Levilactobacillus suantsaiihabitans]
MEHYDGPAFYRKFPVKPTPDQMEDTTDDRSQRQVKLRKERNDRLRIRQEREEKRESAAQSAAREVLHHTQRRQSAASTPATAAKTPEQAAAAASANYRPFAVTPVPKQRQRVWQPSVIRQRYQRLVVKLRKSNDSFLLLGTAADEAALAAQDSLKDQPEPAPTEVFLPDESAAPATTTDAVATPAATDTEPQEAEPQEAEPQEAEPTPEQPASAASVADDTADSAAAIATSAAPANEGTASSVTTTTAATTVASAPAGDETPAAAPSKQAVVGPTEVFYPEPQAQTPTDSGAYLPVDNPVPARSAASETSATPAAKSAQPGETVVIQPTQPVASETPADTRKPTTATGEPTETAEVAETSDTPDEAESTATKESAETNGTTETNEPTEKATEPAEVTAPESPATAESTSAVTPSVSAPSSAAASRRPAEVNQLLDRATAATNTTGPAASSTAAPQSAAAKPTPKPKAKPSRGLGHSLGDIMQEEGNDQRNLALFDRPTAPAEPADTTPARGYHFPDLALLPKPVVPDEAALDEWIEHQAEVLDATLSAFHVDAHVTDWTVGPTVTQFQISLALGVKVNKITNLNDDLKLALAAKDIRIEAPIPGKTTVGIEIPNLKSRPVMLSEILNSAAFKKSESPLTVALGVDLFGQPQVTDLRKMPHGLIAGATGSGKSVFINSLLLSILYKATPQQVKLLLIDPKAVEMAPYDGLPHLLSPVISDPKAAAAALKWVVTEMDERYEKLAAAGVRNIEQFNDRADANDEPGLKMPYIVIIIDELADLMMMAASEVQDYIVRITQKARAAGIHLLVATQRPSVDIVTGTIKNNIPTRIAFMVSSQIDSRTILDTAGAENLLGRGDMLYLGNGASQPMRLQGAFVESEVDGVTDFVRTQGKPQYAFSPKGLLQRETAEENQDELLPKVLAYISQEKTVSTSKLQRVFSIGYNRAANLIDDLEQHHYVSPQHGSKPREVYLTPDDLGKDLPEPHDQGAPFSS